MNNDLISYYKERAKEYENIYHKSERQTDLALAAQMLQDTFINKNVLEIACGTGYWTEVISHTASSVLATDINETVLDIARSKTYKTKVDFKATDFYEMPGNHAYENLFGGFIWSHIKLQDLEHFTDTIQKLVCKGGTIVFMDNIFVEGSSTPIAYTDKEHNTFQTRPLEDGSKYDILKNFPSEDQVKTVLSGKAENISFIQSTYFWILKYQNT